MPKELCLDPSVPNHVDSYIVVGDTIGDKTITEIWSAGTGHVMFTIDKGRCYSFKELIELMEANEREVA